MRSHRLPLALLALAVASCGDSSSTDLASKPPREILQEAAAALDRVTSYRIEGTTVNEDGRTRFSGDFATSGSMRIAMATGKQRVRVIVTRADTFMKATRAYWLAHGGTHPRKVAPLVAGRWLKLTPAIAHA